MYGGIAVKKSNRPEKAQIRIAAYLEKETRRLEKILSLEIAENSPVANVFARLRDRHSAALSDLKAIQKLQAASKKAKDKDAKKASDKKAAGKQKTTSSKPRAKSAGRAIARPSAKAKAAPKSSRSKAD
jgi:hypothetical protein